MTTATPDSEANVGDLLWQLIPIALFGAASPLPITAVVTLLMSERGVAKAIAFGGGLMGVLAVIGVFTLSRSSDSTLRAARNRRLSARSSPRWACCSC